MKLYQNSTNLRKRAFLILLFLVFAFGNTTSTISAVPANDLRDYNRSAAAYDSLGSDASNDSCEPNSGANTGIGEAGSSLPIRLPKINDPKKLADAIDAYIKEFFPASPLNGLGKYFVEGGMRAGINPLLAVAQARHESGFATATDGWHATNPPSYNPLGRSATSSQPHTRYGTSRLVYKYESWQKGLYADAFPANGSASQPDDWFQFVARVYEPQLDDLAAFINRYAPAFENDVPRYMRSIGKYAVEVAERSGGAVDMTQLGSSSGGSGCPGVGTGTMSELTLQYAWPEYKGKGFREMMPAYKAAVDSARSAGQYIGGTRYPGVDCGGFVTRLVVNSGFDPTYNHSAKGGFTGIQLKWARENWTSIGRGSVLSTADLQPGDVAFQVNSDGSNDGHTFIFVGDIDGFGSQIASASLDDRAPMAGKEAILANNIEWFRKK